MSKQREAILRAVQCSCMHPTADQIYTAVRAEIPNVSLGTVYRNLNRLADEGLVNRIQSPFGGDRFDKTLFSHGHTFCPLCGEVGDLSEEVTSALESALGGARYTLCVEKVCVNCSKK